LENYTTQRTFADAKLLQTCCGFVIYVADLSLAMGKLATCYGLATGKLAFIQLRMLTAAAVSDLLMMKAT